MVQLIERGHIVYSRIWDLRSATVSWCIAAPRNGRVLWYPRSRLRERCPCPSMMLLASRYTRVACLVSCSRSCSWTHPTQLVASKSEEKTCIPSDTSSTSLSNFVQDDSSYWAKTFLESGLSSSTVSFWLSVPAARYCLSRIYHNHHRGIAGQVLRGPHN